MKKLVFKPTTKDVVNLLKNFPKGAAEGHNISFRTFVNWPNNWAREEFSYHGPGDGNISGLLWYDKEGGEHITLYADSCYLTPPSGVEEEVIFDFLKFIGSSDRRARRLIRKSNEIPDGDHLFEIGDDLYLAP